MSTQYAYIPVPFDRVPDVLRYLAAEPAVPAWPVALLKRAVAESNDRQRALLAYLANRPDQKVTTQELIDGLGVARSDIIGATGGLTTRAKSRYGQPASFVHGEWAGSTAVFWLDQPTAAAALAALAAYRPAVSTGRNGHRS